MKDEIGFWVTILGTILGMFSLHLTFKVNTKTKDIQKLIQNTKEKESYKKEKESILENLIKAKNAHRKDGSILFYSIKDALDVLLAYNENIYNPEFKKKIDTMEDYLNRVDPRRRKSIGFSEDNIKLFNCIDKIIPILEAKNELKKDENL